jgi:hypothetical protein
MDHLAGEKNILRISVRAIIYDDRLAPAGQTSGVGIETRRDREERQLNVQDKEGHKSLS